MSLPTLRLVESNATDDECLTPRGEVQLSLFDEPCQRTMLCLPMLDLHGATFKRLVATYRPAAVLDLRSHPYFQRPALDRASAFEHFRMASATYMHRSLDLRPPKDQQAMWRMRSEAIEIFLSGIVEPRSGRCTVAVLIHRQTEISVLEQALRDPLAASRWNVVDPLQASAAHP